MSQGTDAARENARHDNGQFGEQHLADPGSDVGLANGRGFDLDEDEFDAQYTSLVSPGGSNVWEYDEVIAAGIPTERVWSVMDGDDGGSYLAPGWHVVNVYGYVVTEQQWADDGLCVQWMAPTDEDGEDVEPCRHDNKRLSTDDNQFYCNDCGEWLGR